jgi:hypothetical protein
MQTSSFGSYAYRDRPGPHMVVKDRARLKLDDLAEADSAEGRWLHDGSVSFSIVLSKTNALADGLLPTCSYPVKPIKQGYIIVLLLCICGIDFSDISLLFCS